MNSAIIVCGLPGTGKTTYAKNIVKNRSILILDIDTVTERMVRNSLTLLGHDSNDRDSNYYKSNFREPVYETLFDIAKENLAFQDSLIVGPFTKELQNKDWPKLLKERLEAKIEIHYLFCSNETRFKRLSNRGTTRDTSKLQDWKSYTTSIEHDQIAIIPKLKVCTDQASSVL